MEIKKELKQIKKHLTNKQKVKLYKAYINNDIDMSSGFYCLFGTIFGDYNSNKANKFRIKYLDKDNSDSDESNIEDAWLYSDRPWKKDVKFILNL